MNINSSFRESEIIRGVNSADTMTDNALRYTLTFTDNGENKSLLSKEIIEFRFNHKATHDTILVSEYERKILKIESKVDHDKFKTLFNLLKQDSHDNQEKQKVLTTPFELSIELIKGNDSIYVSRKEHPADYINYWYCNGRKIFNPKIDQLIVEILPGIILGDFKLLKTPSKKSIQYHKDELMDILNRFVTYLNTRDSVKMKALSFELFPDIHTVKHFEKNKLYYRGIPDSFKRKSESEIDSKMKEGREMYAKSFLKRLKDIKTNDLIELLTTEDDIHTEYAGFLEAFSGHSKISIPRGNGAVEATHYFFKLKINNQTREFSFGEMLRVNNEWESFTTPRL